MGRIIDWTRAWRKIMTAVEVRRCVLRAQLTAAPLLCCGQAVEDHILVVVDGRAMVGAQ